MTLLDGKSGEWNTINQKTGGFRLLDDPVEIPYHPEYIKALRQGDLIAANLETAQVANF